MNRGEYFLAEAEERASILGQFDNPKRNVSTEDFIETYCKIESKAEEGTPIIPFKMWPAQKNALKQIQENKNTIVLKARQLGLTWLVLCYIVHQALKFSGFRAILISETEIKTKELIKRVDLVLRHLPKWLIISDEAKRQYERENGKGSYKGLYFFTGVLYVQIRRGSGEPSEIKAQPATDGAGASLTADIVFFDEWALHRYAEEIFTAAYPTINRPGSGKFIGISTNRRGSFFEKVWENALVKGFVKIFLPWYVDPDRDEEWYQKTKDSLGSRTLQEYPSTEEEAMLAGDNIAFPEFSELVHVEEPFDIPGHWRRWGVVDNGFHDPYFWLKLAVDEDGIVHVYYEQTRWKDEPGMGYSEQARLFAASLLHADEDGYIESEELDFIVAGKDAFNVGQAKGDGKSLIDFYREGGLERQGFEMAVVDRKLRKGTLHEYLKPIPHPTKIDELTNKPRAYAKLQISSDCPYLIECIKRMVLDERNPEVVKDLSDFDNGYDALGYALIAHHAGKSKRTERREENLVQRHKNRLAGKNRGRLNRRSNWR